MRKWVLYAFPMAVAWMFVNATFDGSSFIQGLVVSLPVSYVFRRFHPGGCKLIDLGNMVYVPRYLASFTKELFAANVDTTCRVLHPSKPIDPQMMRYHTSLENPVAITVLANSITLTPGTLVVDFFNDSYDFRINVLSGDVEGTRETVENWERQLSKIFGDGQ
ncbi:Multicomponent Na :H antiporter subunit E [Candidatus Nanohalococcus occultus]|uniref:Multicomponent Na:H antiporter subunit E n=2 Tax=Candidatus Nanohalococcus occultus TaxID=2978047 RepID=A0ABY8CIS0_9ARCH|nr:Multicomponent Na :H antiporter subunit E [Candidatus Nanohaloarchaeota archaeon SVXNc]